MRSPKCLRKHEISPQARFMLLHHAKMGALLWYCHLKGKMRRYTKLFVTAFLGVLGIKSINRKGSDLDALSTLVLGLRGASTCAFGEGTDPGDLAECGALTRGYELGGAREGEQTPPNPQPLSFPLGSVLRVVSLPEVGGHSQEGWPECGLRSPPVSSRSTLIFCLLSLWV